MDAETDMASSYLLQPNPNKLQCSCCYKDPKNFDRFNYLIQGLILRVIELIKDLLQTLPQNETSSSKELKPPGDGSDESSKPDTEEIWTLEDKEKLLQFASKVFLLNFPLYMAFKHSVHSKLEPGFTGSARCRETDLPLPQDLDIPVYLLRNVCYLCEKGGVRLFTSCFEKSSPATLPLSLAHSMICIVANVCEIAEALGILEERVQNIFA
ncbi:USP34 [Cordylochernes scorpioides]|uniref:USP34 n=1 Tax=Cordylochernes scorpioides TaxID=51811 RepID=A0ABY6LQY1_9ARAC|nr:USP34 [Cordylochernes scorpioides]